MMNTGRTNTQENATPARVNRMKPGVWVVGSFGFGILCLGYLGWISTHQAGVGQSRSLYGVWLTASVFGGFALLLLARGVLSRGELTGGLDRSENSETETTPDLVARIEAELEDSRKCVRHLQASEKALQMRVNELTAQLQVLQSDLDSRKRREQSLSKQRQLLATSNSVLELHVQASGEELQKLKNRYELILNSAGEGICGFDRNGKTTFVNPAAVHLTGWSSQELLAKTQSELFGSIVCEQMEGSTGEHILVRKNGSKMHVEFVHTRITEGGCPTGSVLIFKDNTARKTAEEVLTRKAAELARSNAELEQFAFIASHDLQEPLRKIQAFGDRLKTRLDGKVMSDAMDYLDRMQGASTRMRKLIEDLLAFSRVFRCSDPPVQVDLGQTLREVLGDLEVRVEKTGAQVTAGKLPVLEANATQMRQLFLNLVGNALKFQAPGNQPHLKIDSKLFESAAGEPWCEITVQDNGVGFEEEYAEKIFAVFQRLHGRGEYEGNGVGLAICRRIVDRHQGTITAQSQPGQGATFTIKLPLKQPKQELAV